MAIRVAIRYVIDSTRRNVLSVNVADIKSVCCTNSKLIAIIRYFTNGAVGMTPILSDVVNSAERKI